MYGDVVDEELYIEEKFEYVKKFFDCFVGGMEEDSCWIKKVIDVRQWYIFGVEEFYWEINELYEYFSDFFGKFGG